MKDVMDKTNLAYPDLKTVQKIIIMKTPKTSLSIGSSIQHNSKSFIISGLLVNKYPTYVYN